MSKKAVWDTSFDRTSFSVYIAGIWAARDMRDISGRMCGLKGESIRHRIYKFPVYCINNCCFFVFERSRGRRAAESAEEVEHQII